MLTHIALKSKKSPPRVKNSLRQSFGRPSLANLRRNCTTFFRSKPESLRASKQPGLIVGYYENHQGNVQLFPSGQKIDQTNKGKLMDFLKNSQRKGALTEKGLLSTHLKTDHVFADFPHSQYLNTCFIPLGSESKFPKELNFNLRKKVMEATQSLEAQGVDSISLDPLDFQPSNLQALAESAELGLYDYKKPQKNISLHLWNSALPDQQSLFEKGKIIGYAQNLAKKLADTPSNLLTPKLFADTSTRIFSGSPVNVVSRDFDFIKQHKMGLFEGVAKGSEEPPRIVELSYLPHKDRPVDVLLVGKGVTFDTGGINLKPDQHMSDMKGDMGGAAVVVGSIKAISELNLPLNIVGLCGLAENMPDGRALKPEDVLTSMKGLTVEIGNTDAEGRLVLADVLTYGQRTYSPKFVLDIATLTGAIHVALSNLATGVFTNSESFWDLISRTNGSSGDRFWRMPLYPEFEETLSSRVADLNNIAKAGTGGGSCTAATFLNKFIEDKTEHWAHFDIAGVMVKGNGGKMTGDPTKGMVSILEQISKQNQ